MQRTELNTLDLQTAYYCAKGEMDIRKVPAKNRKEILDVVHDLAPDIIGEEKTIEIVFPLSIIKDNAKISITYRAYRTEQTLDVMPFSNCALTMTYAVVVSTFYSNETIGKEMMVLHCSGEDITKNKIFQKHLTVKDPVFSGDIVSGIDNLFLTYDYITKHTVSKTDWYKMHLAHIPSVAIFDQKVPFEEMRDIYHNTLLEETLVKYVDTINTKLSWLSEENED